MTNTEPGTGNTTGRSDANDTEQRDDGRNGAPASSGNANADHANDQSKSDSDDSDGSDGTTKANLGSLNEDVAHPFDQTNGIVEGLEGDSDGTAEGELGGQSDDDEFTVPSPRSAIRNEDE